MTASARNIYIGVMCAAGVFLSLLSLKWPGALSGYFSAFAAMLAVSFVTDVALMRLAGQGSVIPLSIETRFGGFIAGMVLYLTITGLSGASAV